MYVNVYTCVIVYVYVSIYMYIFMYIYTYIYIYICIYIYTYIPYTHTYIQQGEKEIWPMIFEKAWAKLHLSYEATAGGLTQVCMS